MIEKILIAVRNELDFEIVCQSVCRTPNLMYKGQYYCGVFKEYPQIKCGSLEKVGKVGICFYDKK